MFGYNVFERHVMMHVLLLFFVALCFVVQSGVFVFEFCYTGSYELVVPRKNFFMSLVYTRSWSKSGRISAK